IVISFRFTVTLSYIKDYCQKLELTLVTISLFSRMDHLLIVHEKQLLFSLLTFQTLLDSFSSDYHWLSQQTEDIVGGSPETEVSKRPKGRLMKQKVYKLKSGKCLRQIRLRNSN